MGVDFLDVYNAHGEDAVRRAFAGAINLADGHGRIVSRKPLAVARCLLKGLYMPPPEHKGTRWTLARHGDTWLVYDRKRRAWRQVSEEQLRGLARIYLHGYRTWEVNKKGEHGRLNVTKALLSDVLDAMSTDCRVNAEEIPAWVAPTLTKDGRPRWTRTDGDQRVDDLLFDDECERPIDAKDVIAYPNGLLDVSRLKDMSMHSHTPLWFSEQCLPFTLPDERLRGFIGEWLQAVDDGDGDRESAVMLEDDLYGEVCPLWIEKLNEVFDRDAAAITCLQQWFGYCLSSDRSHQVIFSLFGPPGSFKGTASWVLGQVLGGENVGQCTLKELGDDKFILAYVVRKALLEIPDAHVTRGSDVGHAIERLKSISGEDPQTVQRKHGAFETGVKPRCAVMIVSNERLRLPDPSNSLSRRLVVLPTHKSFEGREDRGLKDKLGRELAGISVWALVGLLKLRRDGRFTMPESGRREIEEMKAANAPVYAYVQERCVIQSDSSVMCKVLYDDYKKWAEENGHETSMAASTFGARLKAACPASVRERLTAGEFRNKWVYRGIRPLRDTEDLAEPDGPAHITSKDDLESLHSLPT